MKVIAFVFCQKKCRFLKAKENENSDGGITKQRITFHSYSTIYFKQIFYK
jgi:hypothetical protein